MNMKKRYEIEVDGLPSKIAIVPSSMGLGRPKLYYWDECGRGRVAKARLSATDSSPMPVVKRSF